MAGKSFRPAINEANPSGNAATDIAALVAGQVFGALKIVSPPHTPVPFAPEPKDPYIPSAERIEVAVRAVASA